MYLRYLWYLVRHKWYVGCACFRQGLYFQGITHDWSKFLPSEFIPYARYFYGTYTGDAAEKVGADFDVAWAKHIHRNPHHWQHWVLNEDSGATKLLPIPLKYLKEMACDWQGAGRAIHGRHNPDDPFAETRNWYATSHCQIERRSRDYIEWVMDQ